MINIILFSLIFLSGIFLLFLCLWLIVKNKKYIKQLKLLDKKQKEILFKMDTQLKEIIKESKNKN